MIAYVDTARIVGAAVLAGVWVVGTLVQVVAAHLERTHLKNLEKAHLKKKQMQPMRLCVAANLKRKSLWWWCCRLVLSAWQGLIANFGPQKSLSNVCHIYSTPFIKMPNVWMTSPPLTILMIMTWKPTPPWKPVNPGLQGQEKEPMLYDLTK